MSKKPLTQLPPLPLSIPHPSAMYWEGLDSSLDLLKDLPERGLAIVGTRDPLPQTLHWLENWIANLTGTELILVSGFARGVDACVHASALKAGLRTVAILGAGIDIPYPSENAELRKKIISQGGLLLSEFKSGTPAYASQFLYRNRLIAGWSKAVLVAEARHRSGALNTARWARDSDITCFAVPCFPGSPRFAGNQGLLDGKFASPFWGTHSLGEVWIELAARAPRRPGRKNPKEPPPRNDTEAVIQAAQNLSQKNGGTTSEDLLNWAFQQGWNTERFFSALRHALTLKLISDQSGRLFSPQNPL